MPDRVVKMFRAKSWAVALGIAMNMTGTGVVAETKSSFHARNANDQSNSAQSHPFLTDKRHYGWLAAELSSAGRRSSRDFLLDALLFKLLPRAVQYQLRLIAPDCATNPVGSTFPIVLYRLRSADCEMTVSKLFLTGPVTHAALLDARKTLASYYIARALQRGKPFEMAHLSGLINFVLGKAYNPSSLEHALLSVDRDALQAARIDDVIRRLGALHVEDNIRVTTYFDNEQLYGPAELARGVNWSALVPASDLQSPADLGPFRWVVVAPTDFVFAKSQAEVDEFRLTRSYIMFCNKADRFGQPPQNISWFGLRGKGGCWTTGDGWVAVYALKKAGDQVDVVLTAGHVANALRDDASLRRTSISSNPGVYVFVDLEQEQSR